eukprot:CAMPEP_0177425460 /NCGR_PEP_ID=MMETSP0368-20130122/73026_1 /TAXON_ID=447022 ORGANISM="Scrippsiella hangoei-like, Strain SHHI-4" /NCGR_SAMPLE_ID=MMETSP0368 /ASSEMBLY_ACC=CAM_ASM_000363 /LENGTH=31 /DNA_ID= /DNA_START= /DNA_END= /DNA_ORIENTATION=
MTLADLVRRCEFRRAASAPRASEATQQGAQA